MEHRRVDVFGRQGLDDPFKTVELRTGEGVVGLIGHGQVREQALQG